MKHTFFILTVISLSFLSCKKPHYKACFTADKTTVTVNETITFSNCSDFDGGYTDCQWSFGDGTVIHSQGQSSVEHSYSAIGQYEVRLWIGEKEGPASETITKIIVQ